MTFEEAYRAYMAKQFDDIAIARRRWERADPLAIGIVRAATRRAFNAQDWYHNTPTAPGLYQQSIDMFDLTPVVTFGLLAAQPRMTPEDAATMARDLLEDTL